MYRRNNETFLWPFKPLPGDSNAVTAWKATQRNAQEYIAGFRANRPGRFQARCLNYFSHVFKRQLPYKQVGYETLNAREGERQILYMDRHPDVPLDFVNRRSFRLHKETAPSWLTNMEASTDNDYYIKSRKVLEHKAPHVANMRNDNLHQFNSKQIQEALLLAVQADFERQGFMVNVLAAKYTMKRTSQDRWTLTMRTVTSPLLLQAMDMVTGCWATFQSGVLEKRCQLMVMKADTDKMTLRRGTNEFLHEESVALTLDIGTEMDIDIAFAVPPTAHRLAMTGVIEGLSALPNTFLQLHREPEIGKPLVHVNHLAKLAKGEGFVNLSLDSQQQEAIVAALTHKLPNTPFSILGAAGTGKTAVLVEMVMQLHLNTEEKRPNESLILIVTKSNSGACDLARKLLKAGLPRDALVLLTADSTAVRPDLEDVTHRVYNYVLGNKVQVLVSTSMSGARTGMMRAVDEHGEYVKVCPPTAVFYDECHSLHAPETMAAGIALGHALAHFLFGDPEQLGATCKSKTMAEPLVGTLSPSDTLRASPWYYLLREKYRLHPLAGRHLCLCYRCTPPLTDMMSDIFYDGTLLPAPGKTLEEFQTKLDCFRLRGLLAEVKQPFVWVDHAGVSVRSEVTGSWSNSSEAHRVANIATRLAEVIGLDNIAIIGAYSDQVSILKERLPKFHVTTIDDLQGQERMVTIVSPVRSEIEVNSGNRRFLQNNVGFMGAPRRLCVMLSRARLFSFVVGDAQKFRQTESLHWAKILHHSQMVQDI